MRLAAALTVAFALGAAGSASADQGPAFKAAISDVQCSTFLWLFGTMAKKQPEKAANSGITEHGKTAFPKALALELRAQETLEGLPVAEQAKARRDLVVERHKFRLLITDLMLRSESPERTKEDRIKMDSIIAKCLLLQVGKSKG